MHLTKYQFIFFVVHVFSEIPFSSETITKKYLEYGKIMSLNLLLRAQIGEFVR